MQHGPLNFRKEIASVDMDVVMSTQSRHDITSRITTGKVQNYGQPGMVRTFTSTCSATTNAS